MKKYLLIAISICLISVGIINGGFKDTYKKANMICLECIGIG